MTKAGVRLLMAVITSLGFFGLLAILIVKKIPMENGDILKILIGFLGGAFMTVISFYFGDSDGRSPQ